MFVVSSLWVLTVWLLIFYYNDLKCFTFKLLGKEFSNE